MELIQAVQFDRLDLVNLVLLRNPGCVNETDESGNTALLYAAARGSVDIGKRLIESGAGLQANRKTDINKKNVHGRTALISAAQASKYEFAVLLLEQNGLDLNASANGTALGHACRTGNTGLIEMLIEAGVNINIGDNDGITPLGRIVSNHNLTTRIKRELCDLLIKHGADVNHRDIYGLTPLMYACQEMHVMTEYLLTVPGIDIDIADKYGRTALSWTAGSFNGSTAAIIRLLVKLGADPLIRGRNGQTAQGHVEHYYVDISNLLKLAEDAWIRRVSQACQHLDEKLKLSTKFPVDQKEIAVYIIRLAEYSYLYQNKNTDVKPELIALARNLRINTVNKTKFELCADIVEQLKI